MINEENLKEVTGGKPYDPDPRPGVKCPRCGNWVEYAHMDIVKEATVSCKNCGLEIRIDPTR